MNKLAIDLSKEYGLVLEGGGAKGAYQIGVWKALEEMGVKIRAVAGVSVGALNGALISMGDYDRAEELWSNVSYSSVMDVDDENMDKLLSKNILGLSLSSLRDDGKKFISEKGFNIEPLKRLVAQEIDEKKIKESNIELLLTTFSLTDFKEVDVSSFDLKDGVLADYLMASAAFPLFKNEKLQGKRYIDGGFINNFPIDMLLKRGFKDIITVRIFGIGIEKRITIPDDVNIIEISPKIDLGYVLEFDKKRTKRNISVGYCDGLKVLKPLGGNEYYIENPLNEDEAMSALLNINDNLYKNLLESHRPDGLTKYRMLLENIYPQIASSLRLVKNWDYRGLYYGIIEASGKRLRIPQYKVYSHNEFVGIIRGKLEVEKNPDDSNVLREITENILVEKQSPGIHRREL